MTPIIKGGQSNGAAKDLKKVGKKFKIIWNGKHIQKQYLLQEKFLLFFWKFVKEKGKVRIFKNKNEIMEYILKRGKIKDGNKNK